MLLCDALLRRSADQEVSVVHVLHGRGCCLERSRRPQPTVTSHENRTITGFQAPPSAQGLRSLRQWVRLDGMSAGSIRAKRFLVL